MVGHRKSARGDEDASPGGSKRAERNRPRPFVEEDAIDRDKVVMIADASDDVCIP
jgi:hypothetical protein